MTASATPAVGVDTERNVRVGAGLMSLAGLGFVGYGIIFFVMNFSEQFLELGITEGEVPVGRGEITAFSPELFHYVSHLHLAIAGMLIAIGIGVAVLAWIGVRDRREPWAWWTAVTLPVVTLAIALPAHYPNDLDTIGHLGLIYLATAIFVVGALLSLSVARPRD